MNKGRLHEGSPQIKRVLDRLSGVKRTARGWQAKCPAHEDKNPSLSIGQGKEGRILLHCHAKCTPENICKAIGFIPADLFADKPATNGKSKVEAIYPYHDEQGQTLFEVVRYKPKAFAQRRPHPTTPGEWLWNVTNVRRVLYRLPELIAAVKDTRPIFLPEGEADADALVNAGFSATTNCGGAGKWLAEYNHYFKGAEVIVIADKDTPGRNHAREVADNLSAVAGSVRVMELPDVDGKRVKDARDYFNAGGQAADLDQLAQGAPFYQPVCAYSAHSAVSASSVTPLLSKLRDSGTPGELSSAQVRRELWDLARKCIGQADKIAMFSKWYDDMKTRIKKQSRDVLVAQFIRNTANAKVRPEESLLNQAWQKANTEPLPSEAANSPFTEEHSRRVIACCWWLDKLSNGQPWFLPCRKLCELVPSMDRGQTANFMFALVQLGILKVAEESTGRRGTRYRFCDTQPQMK